MADAELTQYLLSKPKFVETGPDTQTKLQMSVKFADQENNNVRRPSLPQAQKYLEMQEYFCPLDMLEDLLKTNFQQGLTDQQVNDRITEKAQQRNNQESDWKIFLNEINLFAIDLIIALCISIGLAIYGSENNVEFTAEEITTSCLLFIVLVLTIVLGFSQRKKSKSALKKDSGTTANVTRNGKQMQIEFNNLVHGDILEIVQGTLIQVDVRVLESRDLQVQINEDSTNIVQATKGGQIFSGSLIRNGVGIGVVIKTGSSTTIAQIEKRKGGKMLQKQLILFQQIMSLLALIVIILVIIWDAKNWRVSAAYGFRAIEQVIIAMIPQGLLVVVTISMQMATRRMAKMNLLVQSQESIERLSEVNCLCIGLNEVLTSNIFTFHSLYNGYQQQYELRSDQIKDLIKCAILTCDQNQMDGTEKALFDFFKQYEDVCRLMKTQQYYTSNQGVQFRLPFNSSKRYSLSIIVTQNSKYVVYIKGAPEIIWSYCNKTTIQDIDSIVNDQFSENLLNQSKKGLRSIGFAYLEVDSESDLKINDYGYDFTMQNFTYLGTLYLNQSINEDSKEIMKRLKLKSIKLVIITGEHPQTAKYLLQNSGYFENPTMIEGTELYLHVDESVENTTRLSSVDQKLSKWCQSSELIFARTCPEQKLSIVKALQQLNYKVAVTGQGLTDLGSFKQAEVSVSKKYGSQQMIIDSSDLVLTSKKSTFLEIYVAIMESRRAVNNVMKSIMLCLSSNTAMTTALCFYLFLGTPLFLSQNLMLLITITVDLLLGIALAREELEIQNPKKFNVLLYSILVIGIIEASGGILSSFSTYSYFGFTFQDLTFTRFAYGVNATNQTYDPLSPNLGSQYLITPCTLGMKNYSQSQYTQYNINYQWSAPENFMDQRLVFVECQECTQEQIASTSDYDIKWNCWNDYYSFGTCIAVPSLQQNCYTGQASFYASNSFYIFLVLAQWYIIISIFSINYFALRSQIEPFYNQKVNMLAVYGLIISFITLPIITYVPGIQKIFETTDLPWNLLGCAGYPFCFLILGIAELNKYLLRKQIND